MRAFVLMTLVAALTGCHQMPSWNPQGSPCGSSLLSAGRRSCAPASNCSTNNCEQVVAPFGPCGQKYRVIPGRSHQAMTMGWTSLPIPVPQLETIEVPPQLEPLPRPPREKCGEACAPPCGATGRTHAAVETAPQQSHQDSQQEAVRRLLAELQTTRAATQHTGRTEQLQQQTRELESRVDQLLEALETQDLEARNQDQKPRFVPAPGPLPTISSRAPLPRQIIEQTGAYYRTRQQPLQSRSQMEMWRHSPQNPTRGF